MTGSILFQLVLFGFPAAFLLAGVILSLVGVRLWIRAAQTKSWPTTMGIVTQAEVEVSTDDEGSKYYAPKITYQYQVGPQMFISTAYSRGKSGQFSYTGQQRRVENLVRGYGVGHRVRVYYNRRYPSEAILETKPIGCSGFVVSALILLAVGGGILAGVLWLYSL